MNINRFANNDAGGAIFHSTGYAEIAHGSSIGSSSAESFGQRRHINRTRQSVRRYGDSMIAGGSMREAARPHFEANVPRTSARVPLRPTQPRRSFTEPPTRGYNPYN